MDTNLLLSVQWLQATSGQGTVFALSLTTDTLDTLVNFDGSNGDTPEGDLTVSGDTLYGTTVFGGADDDGVVYSITVPEPSTLTLLATFAFFAGIPALRRFFFSSEFSKHMSLIT